MADWTTIADAQVDPKAPVTSELMTALRDNPSAIAEGATGATRIYADSMQGSVAGTTVLFSALGGDAPQTTGGTETIVEGSRFRATTSGAYRISFEHRKPFGDSSTVVIYKNGSSVYSDTTTSSSYVVDTYDITLTAGDTAYVAHHGTDASTEPNPGSTVRRVTYGTGTQRSVGGI